MLLFNDTETCKIQLIYCNGIANINDIKKEKNPYCDYHHIPRNAWDFLPFVMFQCLWKEHLKLFCRKWCYCDKQGNSVAESFVWWCEIFITCLAVNSRDGVTKYVNILDEHVRTLC